MTSSQKTEESTGPGGVAAATGGVPGTASSLPRPASRPTSSTASLTRQTENVQYQTSRTVKHTRIAQGSLKRMSLAVLLDQNIRWEGAGNQKKRVLVPHSPETLKSIREVIASTTGFNTARGDQLTVESLPFESTLNYEAPAPPPATVPVGGFMEEVRRNPKLVGGAAGGAVIFLVVLRAIFALLFRRKRTAPVTADAAPALEAATATADMPPALEGADAMPAFEEARDMVELGPATETASASQITEAILQEIQSTITRDSDAAVAVLRKWMRAA